MAVYNEVATGGAKGGGSAREKRIYKPTGEQISVEGLASADTSLRYGFVQDFTWDIRASFVVIKNFAWHTGPQPLRWFRILGCCRYPTADGDGLGAGGGPAEQQGGCDVIPIETLDGKCTGALGKNQFVENIIARNLDDVCKNLKDQKWDWPICSIQRFTRPAEAAFIDPDDNCNQLEELEFCNVPACFDFCLSTDGVVKIGATVQVIDSIHFYTASGQTTMGGSAGARVVWPEHVAEGGITMGGEAEARASYYAATAEGGITMSGEASLSSSDWHVAGSGGITVSGESEATSPTWHYSPSGGGVSASGAASYRVRLFFKSNGRSNVYPKYAGVNIGGRAGYPIKIVGSGGITMGGSADANTPSLSYIPAADSGIVLGGEAGAVSPDWHYTAAGGVTMGGEGVGTTASYHYAADGGVATGGAADVRNSIGGTFWYNSAEPGSVAMGGSAEAGVKLWRYRPTGETVQVGGAAGITSTWQGIFTAYMGMGTDLDDVEVVYSPADDAPQFTSPTATVNTKCGECNAMPLVLYLTHNLENGNVLREFLLRNGLSLPASIPMRFSSRLGAWQGTLHYTGIADDNVSHTEQWRILFEWGCVDTLASQELGVNVWKFSMLATRKNLTTGMDFDTRIMIVFPAEQICLETDDLGFDFNFRLDTRRIFVKTELDIVVDVRLLYDNIGLFKSRFWVNTPDLRIRLSPNEQIEAVERQDIKPIFPPEPLLVPID